MRRILISGKEIKFSFFRVKCFNQDIFELLWLKDKHQENEELTRLKISSVAFTKAS